MPYQVASHALAGMLGFAIGAAVVYRIDYWRCRRLFREMIRRQREGKE